MGKEKIKISKARILYLEMKNRKDYIKIKLNEEIRIPCHLVISGILLLSGYKILKAVAQKNTEPMNIDDDNPYIDDGSEQALIKNQKYVEIRGYIKAVKPLLDSLLSFLGLIILSPVYGIISLAIYIEDPGPIFFTQKRVGKDKHYFFIHKFRSMYMDTPNDVPTHLLKNPEQYITKVGKILRQTSLDELPQIWDIFRGKMSIIGPRPALWNQEDLIEERDKYGANNVLPGLTGLAQINGRDELEIPLKAKYDGDYVKVLNIGGTKAFVQDAFCFFGTVLSILRHDGVVEGGTGQIHRIIPKESEVGFEEYAFQKTFSINTNATKRVLITGAGSYIGEAFKNYATLYYPSLTIDTVDMVDGNWRLFDFKPYDTVFHVAGIAHADIGNVDQSIIDKYYSINRDLAIETAKVAKAAGVRQFLFISSMIIYGDSAPYGKERIIDEYTIPTPVNFYGDSKWQADKGIRELNSKEFAVAVLRLPMVYGKGAKGNYSTLVKLAKWLLVFPDVDNRRSMIHIDNLCEFVSLLILSGENGIYFPQNSTYTKTSFMVRTIAEAMHCPIKITKLLKPAVWLASHVPGKLSRIVNKAFGNCIFDQKLSNYNGLDYHIVDLKKSLQ